MAEVNGATPLAPAKQPWCQGWGKSGKCLLSPGAGGAAVFMGPSSLWSTTHSRHHPETTLVRHCFLALPGSAALPAHADCAGSCSDQGHGGCAGVFDFIVPTQWRKCNTDTACVLGVWSYTCASSSVLLQVKFQLGFFYL